MADQQTSSSGYLANLAAWRSSSSTNLEKLFAMPTVSTASLARTTISYKASHASSYERVSVP